MLKYHNHPVNGPTKCRVGLGETVRGCPFGSLETEHYATIEEAQAAFEKKVSEDYETTGTMNYGDPKEVAVSCFAGSRLAKPQPR